MTYASLAALSRYAKTGLLDIINADFIRTARAKGLQNLWSSSNMLLEMAMIPILTLLATLLPVLIGGSVVIETNLWDSGMGRYGFEAIHNPRLQRCDGNLADLKHSDLNWNAD